VAAAELAVKLAVHDRRFGAALAASVVIHAGAMMLSPSTSRLPQLDVPMPLSVQLVREPLASVQEAVRPVHPPATKPARAQRVPPRQEAPVRTAEPAPQPQLPVEAVQPAPMPEAPASAPDPLAPPPLAAAPESAPDTVALLAPAPPPRFAPSAEMLSDYTRSLSKALERYKEYPRIAELRGWEGSVTMRLRVAPTGRLIEAQVYKSSGVAVLDQQAVAMVSKAGALPVPPEGLDADGVPVLVPITFRLER
jgi:protein TonB